MDKSKNIIWAGRVLGWVVSLPFLMGIVFALTGNPQMAEGMKHFGWSAEMVPVIIGLEAVCSLLYLIPKTEFIGAILLTGYLGGAIATHVRIGEYPVFMQVTLGVLIWISLLMRKPAMKNLLC